MRTLSRWNNGPVGALIRGVMIGVVLAGVFLVGVWFGGTHPSQASDATPGTPVSAVGQYPLLTQAQQLLNDHFLRDQPSQKELEYAAIRGILTTLNDKYTFLVDPPVAHSESDVLAGQYGGIGVLIKRDEAGNFALYPFPDGPATKAGVQNGDLLLQINGKDVSLSTQPDALDQMLRGEVKDNHGVTIHVKRPASGSQAATEKDFTIPFAVIDVPSVVWHTLTEDPTMGYVQILRFTSRTPDEVKTAVTDLKSKNVKSLVLDVRDNPGGLLQESVQVAGQFLDGGVIVYEHSRTDEKPYEANKGGLATAMPLVVIVNHGTASAAELVAAAIQDRKRGIVVGQQTYGKGSVQLIFTLADQSSLHITTAEWLTPNKNTLDGKGITPDMPVTPDSQGKDVELSAAISYLQAHHS